MQSSHGRPVPGANLLVEGEQGRYPIIRMGPVRDVPSALDHRDPGRRDTSLQVGQDRPKERWARAAACEKHGHLCAGQSVNVDRGACGVVRLVEEGRRVLLENGPEGFGELYP